MIAAAAAEVRADAAAPASSCAAHAQQSADPAAADGRTAEDSGRRPPFGDGTAAAAERDPLSAAADGALAEADAPPAKRQRAGGSAPRANAGGAGDRSLVYDTVGCVIVDAGGALTFQTVS